MDNLDQTADIWRMTALEDPSTCAGTRAYRRIRNSCVLPVQIDYVPCHASSLSSPAADATTTGSSAPAATAW